MSCRTRSSTAPSRSTLTTKPSPSTSWTSPSLTASSAASHLTVLTTATSSSPTTSRAGRLATTPSCSNSGPGSPNSRLTDASSAALGSRRLTQTKVSPDAVAPAPPDLSW